MCLRLWAGSAGSARRPARSHFGLVNLLALAATCSVAVTARASEAKMEAEGDARPEVARQTEPRPMAPSPARHALAVAGSIVPGVLVHGTGHYILGRPRTGTLLLVMEGIGALTLVGSIGVLALTGANRDLVGPTIGTAIGGGGLFSISWLADMYGSAVPESARGGAPKSVPFLLTELGYRYVYDLQFRYRSFAALGVDLRYERLRLAPSAWQSLDDDNGRYRLLTGYRFIGPTRGRATESSADGSFVEVELAGTYHRYDSDGFRILTGEGFASSRLDLARLDPLLGGSFAELGLGWALQRIDYGSESNAEPVLLGRFAFGAYIGDPVASGGDVRVYYDHRHDDFAAGLKVSGLGSGALGHFGLDARWFMDERWGILLDAQAGSAVVIGASLLMRQGSLP